MSVDAHLSGQNNISFSPAGLKVLQQLGEVTGVVHDVLQERIQQKRAPKSFAQFFPGDSSVSRVVASLSDNTSKTMLRELSNVVDPALKTQIESLIAELTLADPTGEAKQLDLQRADIVVLITRLKELAAVTSDDRVNAFRSAIEKHQQNSNALALLSVDRFRHRSLTSVGSDAWNVFVKAAHSLALQEVHGTEIYPKEHDICLLCQQELSPDARSLLKSLWQYLAADAQRNFNVSKQTLLEEASTLSLANVSVFDEQSACYRSINKEYPVFAASIT